MNKKEYAFCVDLHNRLRDVIKPSVFITIESKGKLSVTIYDKFYGITYEWHLNKFGEMLKKVDDDSAISIDVISNSIIRDYRKFIYAKFFKKFDDRLKGGENSGRNKSE